MIMNENLDLTKILDGCPKGTEFYHAGFGRVWFVGIDLDSDYPIRLSLNNDPCDNTFLTKKGTVNVQYDGECILFPSRTQRDWSKFERFWDKTKVEKFDPKTLQPFENDKVLVRADKNDCWMAAHFSHVDDYTHKAVCDTFYYTQCIPYNEETKHLVGKIDDCPEYYRWWEE